LAYEKGPDLSGARLEDLDLSRSRLHAPNFEGAKITDAWFINADISGDFEGLRLTGWKWPGLPPCDPQRGVGAQPLRPA
jgi:uncharacterized protein YjbI with pentapeptide repeats